ncbi:hypothetical protein [Peribacillus loiseleuriae]|uniref:hypothetical protein n=1 Tax=Peribacillus loiseleuriae TaxID=1679170 RepID=UPI000AE0C1A8|nr:hypothetical protein [Peribacillus loiseleuriae]
MSNDDLAPEIKVEQFKGVWEHLLFLNELKNIRFAILAQIPRVKSLLFKHLFVIY